MKKKISTIIFDLRNILLQSIQADIQLFIAEKLGIKDQEKLHIIKDCISQYELGEISTELLINGLIKESELPVQALDLIRLWNKILLGVPEGTPSLLKSLKKKYSTFIIANTNPLHIQWTNRHLNQQFGVSGFVPHWVDGVFYSHLIRSRTTDPAFYAYVQNKVATPPEKILLIDESSDNLHCARLAGWNTQSHLPNHLITSTFNKMDNS